MHNLHGIAARAARAPAPDSYNPVLWTL